MKKFNRVLIAITLTVLTASLSIFTIVVGGPLDPFFYLMGMQFGIMSIMAGYAVKMEIEIEK